MVRNFLLAITLAVSLVVPVAAQSAPLPFLQQQMAPAAPAVQDTGKGKSTPATPAVDPAQNPGGATGPQEAIPAQPGIIQLDPAMLQQLFGQIGPVAPPTPEQLEAVYELVWAKVGAIYHDPAKLKDWHLWQNKYKGKLTTPAELESALQEMLSSLDDKWTLYVSTSDIQHQQQLHNSGQAGLGVMVKGNADGTFAVDYLPYGTSGYTSELKRGDIVKSVGGTDLAGKTLKEAEELLSGKAGLATALVYTRDGKDKSINLTFADAPDNAVDARLLPDGIGYIRLPAFDKPSFGAFLQGLGGLYTQSKGNLRGLIVDLRGNPGGEFTLALDFASIFMEKGTITSSTTRDGRMVTHQSYETIPPQSYDFAGAPADMVTMIKSMYRVPMVLLVDGSSASSSEVVTGAIKDNNRAVVVGTTTYGKGVGFIQERLRGPGGILMITSLDYVTPSGYNLSSKGIAPNKVVERTPGSPIDEQLAAGIEVIKQMTPDPLQLKPTVDPNQKNGADGGDLTANPLVISFIVALLALLGVWSFYHHKKSNEKRAEEERRRREDRNAE